MKRFLLLWFLFQAVQAGKAQNTGDRLIGKWLNEDKKTKIEFFKTGNTYSGKIVWISEPNGKDDNSPLDKNNPDHLKRKQKIIGLTIISGLRFSENNWINGTIYSPKRGIYANCRIIIKNFNQLQITISKGVFTDTKIWTKE